LDLVGVTIYKKYLCYVNQTANYATAEATCNANNMKLLTIVNPVESVAIKSTLAARFKQGIGMTLWINGQQQLIGSWQANAITVVFIPSKEWPTNAYSSLNRLQITNSGGAFATKAADGAEVKTFACEYFIATPFG
jgi:hypothetical protein